MSWQAMEAVRDHSKSRGATRTVMFVLASYADKNGDGIFPGLSTICEKAKVSRKTAVDARHWPLDNEEAEIVGYRKSGTPELSFAPLLARVEGSASEPLAGSATRPPTDEGVHSVPPGGSIHDEGGSLSPRQSSVAIPEPEVNPSVESSNKSSVDQSPFSTEKNSKQQREDELPLLLEQLPGSTGALREQTERAIQQLEAEIAPTADHELHVWASRLPSLAVAG